MTVNSPCQALPLSVGIVGCGWLGTALAKQLIAKGTNVVATTGQVDNVKSLVAQGISASSLLLPAEVQDIQHKEVFQQQVLIVAITPKFKQQKTDYPLKVKLLVQAARQANKVQRIILISSTAIYNGLEGHVTETRALNFSAKKVEILHKAEQEVLDYGPPCCVLRLAGLVGPKRHPGNFLTQKRHSRQRLLTNAQASVNLIHQEDAVGLILALLKYNQITGVFNGVSQTKACKKEYYHAAAQRLGVTPPKFAISHEDSNTRVVCGAKACQQLSYQFVYPDLLSWL